MLEKTKTEVSYGNEPGLRFALVLDGHGGCRTMNMAEACSWKPGDGLVWLHFERDHPATAEWINTNGGFDPLVAEALLAEDSRPRVEPLGDGLLIILRGVCAAPPEEAEKNSDEIDLVPLHIWVDEHRLVTLRDSGHYITALRDIRRALDHGKGPRQAGELLALVSDKLVRDLEPVLDDMDEEVDELDELIFKGEAGEVRQRLKLLRRRAVQLRRYLAPQRDALNRIEHDDAPWLRERDKLRFREVIDKLMRFIEYLDAIRDRTGILHDDLSTVIGERIARNSNRLAALAALLLPPSVVAGLFGMNVGGIPGVNDTWAFLMIVALVIVISAGTLWILKRIEWL
ncbi:CorA family divalent cation transporter [Neorhizobium galegae]|uniref:CorA family divalent cation transporter n=1 Tax=Neorhizobium galegae TaxID=399 RepID=UPI0006219A42|nr:CorA family divalent cation transporter [Neorhizobium galegae]CDZ28116.1 Zinc transport protein ZntB [Neorhizobium galegae bv. officinalis]KAA9386856.1 zinc transporter ZntB [Neorhizobium galegae]KAB1115999.1 zinc transporter ZntB [Neorhizobium galegae]MCM2499642.1 zinc transporter ZntB [Neorhizobium galegae]MCQ1764744.1 zinc transporter ZntB [Neorhizobium galegae]